MRLLLHGPLSHDKPSQLTRDVISFLETSEIDVSCIPTILETPISHYAATMFNKAVVAPFDALLAIHDTKTIHTSKEAYTSSEHRIAYVIHRDSPTWSHNLAVRLRPFGFVIAANSKTADAIESVLHKRPRTATPEEVVEMLREIPGRPIVHDVDKNAADQMWPQIEERLRFKAEPLTEPLTDATMDDFKRYFEEAQAQA